MNNFSSTPSAGAQSWYNDFGMNTNVYKVTSLEEAIMRSNMRPSETIYFHQSKNEFYNVRVDVNGNKTWQTFTYNVMGSSEPSVISREEFDKLVARVNALDVKSPEVVNNG